MRTRPIRIIAVLAAFGMLAACSDDDSSSADDTTTTTMAVDDSSTTAAEPTETTDGSMDEGAEETAGDIVDTAVAAGDFETLVAAVQAAGLEDTLRGDGPFTVFAPTDDAFAALPEGTVETLLEEPEGTLADILTYHVISGEVMAADVVGMDGESVATVNGASITINVDGENVSLTDAAGNTVNVVATDVTTDNGVIHVLDGVLMPG